MYLEIRNILPEDFGEYHCVAKNPLGETEGTIKVYERTRKPTPGVFDPDTITNDLFPPNDRVLSSYNSVANPICRSNNIFILAVVGYFLL